jgi:protease secretion system membrane fusion protein
MSRFINKSMNRSDLGSKNLIEQTPQILTDTAKTARTGFLVLVIGFGGFLLWAGYAPLDEGVPAPAIVTVETKRKAIQHQTGGIVERVAVREGQRVKAGDTLIEMNDGTARANYELIRQNYIAQRAAESRLVAEMEGRTTVLFHHDLVNSSSDPVIQLSMFTQSQLFESRRSSLKSELAAADESIAGQEAKLAGIFLQIESRNTQAQKKSEQQKSISELASAGYVPKNQALQIEEAQAELNAVIAELRASKVQTERTIAELKQKRSQRVMEISKENAAQLAEIRREVQAGRDKLNASKGDLVREIIKAPVDGQVIGIAIASIGGVITPGQKLMDIVPAEEGIVLEARIPTHVIDRIHNGDKVAVRFSSFAHSPQLVVEAIINSISEDVIVEQTPAGNTAFYLARVSLTRDGEKGLAERRLQPGMGAEVLIKTGERSLLTYILHPLTKRIAAAMKEE